MNSTFYCPNEPLHHTPIGKSGLWVYSFKEYITESVFDGTRIKRLYNKGKIIDINNNGTYKIFLPYSPKYPLDIEKSRFYIIKRKNS